MVQSAPFDINEALPGDTDVIAQHPVGARLFRDIVESWLKVDHDVNGLHNKVSLPERADPTLVADQGFLYSKDVSAISELFYMDSAGKVVQMTTDGLPKGAVPAGTTMFFGQATAPTGWTQNTTWNDRVLRVVSGSGAGTGGSWTISGLTNGVTGSHTLTIAEMPSHDHPGTYFSSVLNGGTFGVGGTGSPFTSKAIAQGGGGGHTHPGSTITSDGTWRPSRLDVIAADKD